MTAAGEQRALRAADLELRAATLDDAAFVADLFTELFPEDPEDPVLTRHWWQTADPDLVVDRNIAHHGGKPAGLAARRHSPWEQMPERYDRLSVDLRPALRTPERVNALYDLVEARSRDDGGRTFVTWAWEHDRPRLELLASRGYREERRERFWELDLVAGRERLLAMAEDSRVRMREQGVRVLTLDRDEDPERYRKLWRLSDEAEQDIPTTVPHVPLPFEAFTRWFASPGLREDRIWIARENDQILGISMLSYPPVRGVVVTDWTATARAARGRGVARALKCETVAQAIALGVDCVRTDNDGENAPILHINASMGYQRRPDMVQLLKPA